MTPTTPTTNTRLIALMREEKCRSKGQQQKQQQQQQQQQQKRVLLRSDSPSSRNVFQRVVKKMQATTTKMQEEEPCQMEVSMVRRDSDSEGILALMEHDNDSTRRQESQERSSSNGSNNKSSLSTFWESFTSTGDENHQHQLPEHHQIVDDSIYSAHHHGVAYRTW
eukprot:CAMPEP_0116849042 /NCGR_PEP_ID=MMETSP0418-20121206/15349_1 /TAXON_ID=1158023 /ORGANISM="Astrosyne radiata, Strain 13vi08-1A" /LENGTH=165 /DNA_ID=CAMNT_0004480713 /DNA_START=97 /DNA_END=594 /DNA_ORIENTATION=-